MYGLSHSARAQSRGEGIKLGEFLLQRGADHVRARLRHQRVQGGRRRDGDEGRPPDRVLREELRLVDRRVGVDVAAVLARRRSTEPEPTARARRAGEEFYWTTPEFMFVSFRLLMVDAI